MKTAKGAVTQSAMAALVVLAMGVISLFSTSVSAESQSDHLKICKLELKALYGDDVRIRMVKAKQYQGQHKMTLKVYPAGEAMTVVECVSNDAPEPGIVLMAKDGSIFNA
ncbi:hypothetical protein ACMAY6_11110 [Luminiphilus sp. nBUS_16]|uniref:hypothetical protein n=1 Tax=Luminiphilus sp. nBUS_16 TaxID=3395315 RepID=UPI003EB739A7